MTTMKEVPGRALSDFEPLDSNGVELVKGEEVTVLDYDSFCAEKSTYLKVRLKDGKVGLVLACVVECLPNKQAAQPQQHTQEKALDKEQEEKEEEKSKLSWSRRKSVEVTNVSKSENQLTWARKGKSETQENKNNKESNLKWQRRGIETNPQKSSTITRPASQKSVCQQNTRQTAKDPTPFLVTTVVFFLFLLILYDIVATRHPFLIVMLGFMPRAGMLVFQLINMLHRPGENLKADIVFAHK